MFLRSNIDSFQEPVYLFVDLVEFNSTDAKNYLQALLFTLEVLFRA
jgi:hypothetical protein